MTDRNRLGEETSPYLLQHKDNPVHWQPWSPDTLAAAKTENKFADLAYRMSGAGMPIIEESVAWIDCDLHAVHEAGDHFIVLGRVHALDAEHAKRPLLFFQGGYGQFSPMATSAG